MQEHLNIAVVAAIMVGDGVPDAEKISLSHCFYRPFLAATYAGGSARNVASVRARSLLDKFRAGYIAVSIN